MRRFRAAGSDAGGRKKTTMSYSASAAADVAAMRDPIPLDLAPLITPYRQHRRLSIRVVHLPARAELTRGQRNEDASWSLAPEDLDGLALLLPEDVETPPSVAIRIVVVDRNENASIVGQFEVPLPRRGRTKPTSESANIDEIQAEWQARLERRRAAAERLARRKAALAVAKAEVTWQQRLAGERDGLAAAETRLGQAENEVARLQREVAAALARDAAAAAAAEEAARAQQQAIEARVAENVETKLSAARAAWEQEAAARLDAARDDSRRATETLDARLAEARAEWQMESEGRLAAREQALELSWRQKLQDVESARQAAEARAAEAARKAERLTQENAAATQRLAAAETAAAQRASETQAGDRKETKALDARLAAARADWRKESEARSAEAVAQAVRRTEAVAESRLRQAREAWEREAREALAAAEGKWRAEAARRLAAAQTEWRQSVAAKATAGRRKLRGVARRQGWKSLARKILLLGVLAAVAVAGVLLFEEIAPLARQWLPKIGAFAAEFSERAVAELRTLIDALAARL